MGDEISEWSSGWVGRKLCDSQRFWLHLQATRETLTVRVAWKKHALRKDQVSAIRRYNERHLFFGHKVTPAKGIQIIHTDPNCPPFLVFYGGHEATLERFRQLGYNVTEDTGTESVEVF